MGKMFPNMCWEERSGESGRQETTKGKSERRGEEERENRGTVNIHVDDGGAPISSIFRSSPFPGFPLGPFE